MDESNDTNLLSLHSRTLRDIKVSDNNCILFLSQGSDNLNELLEYNIGDFLPTADVTPFTKCSRAVNNQIPIAVSLYRLPVHKKAIPKEELDKLLRDGSKSIIYHLPI